MAQGDFMIQGGGTLFIVTPLTDEAKAWVDDHISEDAIWFGRGFAVEHRYIDDIAFGITNDGLEIVSS